MYWTASVQWSSKVKLAERSSANRPLRAPLEASLEAKNAFCSMSHCNWASMLILLVPGDGGSFRHRKERATHETMHGMCVDLHILYSFSQAFVKTL